MAGKIGKEDAGLFQDLAPRPLADRLRPARLDEVVGQDHLLAPDGPIGRMVAGRRLGSMVLWGPPGCGKTTLARLLAAESDLAFEPLSAVFSGIADVRKAVAAAADRRAAGRGTLLFVDEIHRFNKAQQDGFLPYVEDGTVVLVGATTENPSFELNAALLSRAQVFVLNRLDAEALETLLKRAEATLGRTLPLMPEARTALIAMADGDGRYVLNMAEELSHFPPGEAARRGGPCDGGSEAGAGLRQGRRGALQPDQARCIRAYGAPMPTRRSTGWHGCSPAARTRPISPAG